MSKIERETDKEGLILQLEALEEGQFCTFYTGEQKFLMVKLK